MHVAGLTCEVLQARGRSLAAGRATISVSVVSFLDRAPQEMTNLYHQSTTLARQPHTHIIPNTAHTDRLHHAGWCDAHSSALVCSLTQHATRGSRHIISR